MVRTRFIQFHPVKEAVHCALTSQKLRTARRIPAMEDTHYEVSGVVYGRRIVVVNMARRSDEGLFKLTTRNDSSCF